MCVRWVARRFRRVVDRRHALEEIVEAYGYVGSGQKIGSVLVVDVA